MKKLVMLISSLFLFSNVGLSGEATKLSNKKYSEVVVTKKKSKKGADLFFKVNIGKGIKYNWEGPWKLKVTADGMEKVVKGTSEFDKKTNGFSAAVPSSVKKVEYRLTAFVCTSDKKKCFREVHKASVDI